MLHEKLNDLGNNAEELPALVQQVYNLECRVERLAETLSHIPVILQELGEGSDGLGMLGNMLQVFLEEGYAKGFQDGRKTNET